MTVGARVLVPVDVSDDDGKVARLSYRLDGEDAGEDDLQPPVGIHLAFPAPGQHVLEAIAVDAQGLLTTARLAIAVVEAPPGPEPSVVPRPLELPHAEVAAWNGPPPVIDGRLDEAAWAAAEPFAAFHRDYGQPAAQPTTVRLLRQADRLLVGVACAEAPELAP